jgi:hypothetical protein
VFGSCTLPSAEIMAQTNAEGGCRPQLAGGRHPTSLALLRSRGRFLELGKRDITSARSALRAAP